MFIKSWEGAVVVDDDRLWVPSPVVGGLQLGPHRIVPLLLAVARKSGSSSWRRCRHCQSRRVAWYSSLRSLSLSVSPSVRARSSLSRRSALCPRLRAHVPSSIVVTSHSFLATEINSDKTIEPLN
ncbi:uncharacterized protein DS421_7g219450 [Arachis hypogaea]|uniref:Uncharacterized protein n=1 Tax=Arachis hypogaea TaxID=3818 RepID=A0A445CGZ9_ARAHY|nr:uncharacterized protein DS421_7g219450 [Arachis hypogaea]RYR50209.1 hypothetical protein Ahy_A07g036813 isoform A [Arachis hypogaea]